jgi:Protein of unknown function (DUF3800)
VRVCYVDEAGDLGALPAAPSPSGNDQPALVIGALFLDSGDLHALTRDFLDIKYRYFPRLAYPTAYQLDRILPEVKGADIRTNATRGNARQRHHAFGFLDRLMGLLTQYNVKLAARIWIKGLGMPFDPTPVYTSSIQSLCTYFHNYLELVDDIGICLADSRNKSKNTRVSHSLFTQKYKPAPNYSRLIELPTFGHSDNHAGLQVCDLVCSALLFPIACFAYCTGHVANVHVQPDAADLRQRYGQTLKALQYRYQDETGRWRGGLVLNDAIAQRNAAAMFA